MAHDSLAPLIVIAGATGTGKSGLSLDLAERLGDAGRPAEIINADAMQLYRGMDIGTAKLPQSQRRQIPHHLLDVLDVADEASVAGFQAAAREAITAILGRGSTPVLVGGSGLYISSVIFDFQFPGTDAALRAVLEQQLLDDGPGTLYRRLRELDPPAAEAIGPHNGRRIVRALEVIELTGKPFGAGLTAEQRPWRTDTRLIVTESGRAELVSKLDERVVEMWSAGLLAEVESLLPLGIERGVTASRAIGYAQAIGQLRGELSEAQAVELTQSLTRKYARRQVSWFRRYSAAHRLDLSDSESLAEAVTIAAEGSATPPYS